MHANDPGTHRYTTKVRDIPRLEREEERELALRFRDRRDPEAARRIVEAHLSFVVAAASRYRRYKVPLADLIAEGNFALMEALERFDPDRELRFVTYAAFWIRARIVGAVLKNWSMARSGRGALKSRIFFKLRRERARLVGQLGESEQVLERLAEVLSLPKEKTEALLRQLDATDVSLDQPLSAEGRTLLDGLEAPSDAQDRTLENSQAEALRQRIVRQAVAELDRRERTIAEARFLADTDSEVTLAELGRRLGVSRERVRQLEDRAKLKLRQAVLRISCELGTEPLELLHAA